MEKISKRESYHRLASALQELTKSEGKSIDQLGLFQGFGLFKELLFPVEELSAWSPEELKYKNEVEQIHSILKNSFGDQYSSAIQSIRNSVLSSYYTPETVINPIVESLSNSDVRSILEPSAGSGNFIQPLQRSFPNASITAIEKDTVSFQFLRSLHPRIETINGGFENIKPKMYDLVVSNVPFGAIGVYDDIIFRQAIPAKVKATTRIHNYFFVKGLDNLVEGGRLAFITSSATMDSPGNREIREYLMKNADLLSAIRLPNDVFEASGTSPVTDIIILQKNSKKKNLTAKEQAFIQTEKLHLEEKGINYALDINSYYRRFSDRALGEFAVGGQYRKDGVDLLPFRELDLEDQIKNILKADLSNGPVQGYTVAEIKKFINLENVIPKEYPNYEWYRGENLIVFRNQVGKISGEDEKRFTPEPVIKDVDRTGSFIELRIAQAKLLQAEISGTPEMDSLRTKLNEQYDSFTFRFGHLYHPANKKLSLFDADGFTVLSLENLHDGTYVKADIFKRQVNNVEKGYAQPQNFEEALIMSLNATGKVDINFISELVGKEQKEVINEGLQNEMIFLETNGLDQSYVTKDEFLSGNVSAKIELLQHAVNQIALPEGVFENHITRLKEVRPVYLKRELIDINIGERWIKDDIYRDFAQHLFKVPCEITFIQSQDLYAITLRATSNENEITWSANTASGKIRGFKILEYAMADTTPYLQIRIPDTEPPKYMPDVDGMKNVETKINEIKQEFDNFISSNKEVAHYIEETYNRTINNTVKRQFDGRHLQLANCKSFAPYPHQKNATWMLLQNDGGIIDHKVGAGKTLVIINTAMEMKRLGISNKPLILCLKANVSQIAKQFKDAYPDAKILAPTDSDFKPAKRKAIFASIAANEWDSIILTHDQFLAIPQSQEKNLEILNEEMKNLLDDLKAVRGNESLSKRLLKGLEVRKSNLSVRIKSLEASIKRDTNVLDFAAMGFDHLFVDESQQFKNLHYTTRHAQVAGLGDPQGSTRAFNMQIAIRTIQAKKGADRGVTFLSGTTISNSLVELYLLFKYLRPQKLAELQINSFDSWAKMYARKSSNYEFTVTNEIKRRERFREFIKVPELAMFYSEITDVVGDATLKIDKPKTQNVVINIDPTHDQNDYIEKLIKFTKTKNPAHVGLDFSESEMKAFMLIATNLAKKMSLDLRLIDSDMYSFEPSGKLAKVAEVVADEYRDSSTYKGTQLVFSDVGTPNPNSFNLYYELKRILVELHQLPDDQIQFIHDHDTKKKREILFEKVNSGDVRILIGSTQKLGTGVNVQKRIIAMHHLDIPWRPSDFEQRNGRGERQGNHAARDHRGNIVKNYIYAVNRTLDAYQFNILSNKQKFINQIKAGSIDNRKIDEGSMDQDGGMNFGEYVALLSGNTDLLEKVRLEKKLADLERSYSAFLKTQADAEFQMSGLSQEKNKLEKMAVRLKRDFAAVTYDVEKEPMVIEGKKVEDRSKAGEWIHKRINELKADPSITLGQQIEILRQRDFVLYYSKGEGKSFVLGPEKVRYLQADGKVNETQALAGRYLIDCIKRIPKSIDRTEADIIEKKDKMVSYQKILSQDFKEKGDIVLLRREIELLGQKIEKAFKREEQPNKVMAKRSGPEISL